MTSATTGSSYLVHTISQKIRWQIISYLERFVTVYSKVRYFQWYFTGHGPGWPEPGLAAGGCWVICQFSTLGRAGHILLELSGLIIYLSCYLGHKHRNTQYKYLDTTFMFYFCSFAAAFEYSVLRCCLSPGQYWHIAVNKEAFLFSSTQLSALINP